jgi:hypothetical protein
MVILLLQGLTGSALVYLNDIEVIMMYFSQNEINVALSKLLKGEITKKQYERIVEMYKPIQE